MQSATRPLLTPVNRAAAKPVSLTLSPIQSHFNAFKRDAINNRAAPRSIRRRVKR
jgi:hypothetical protein